MSNNIPSGLNVRRAPGRHVFSAVVNTGTMTLQFRPYPDDAGVGFKQIEGFDFSADANGTLDLPECDILATYTDGALNISRAE